MCDAVITKVVDPNSLLREGPWSVWKSGCLSPKAVFAVLFAVVVCGEKEPDAFKFGNLPVVGMGLCTAQVNAGITSVYWEADFFKKIPNIPF